MKTYKALLLVLLLTSCSICHSKQMRFVEYSGFDDKGVASQMWDLGKLSVEDSHSAAWVRLRPSGIYSECLDAVTNHYFVSGDTVFLRGYNQGRELSALVQNQQALYQYPLRAGFKASKYMYAVETDINGPKYHNFFYCDIAISSGRFIVAGCDTIDATMVQEHRHGYKLSLTNDSVPYQQSIYRWYSPAEKIPFALQINDGAGRNALFYDSEHLIGTDASYNKEESIRKAVENTVVESFNGYVSISISGLDDRIVIDTYIIDIPGNIYEYLSKEYGGDDINIRISTAGLKHGQYMVVISANTQEPIVEKRIVVL